MLGSVYAANETNASSTNTTGSAESADDPTNLSTLGEPSLRDESTILGSTLTNATDDADAIDVRTLANELAYWST